ncbi:hypothetical protein ACHAPQ_010919 [Fusarium lateritium]
MEAEAHDAIAIRGNGAKPRRAHKKAKTGCADCRKRRVKRGEAHVSCVLSSRGPVPIPFSPNHIPVHGTLASYRRDFPIFGFNTAVSPGPPHFSDSRPSHSKSSVARASVCQIWDRGYGAASPLDRLNKSRSIQEFEVIDYLSSHIPATDAAGYHSEGLQGFNKAIQFGSDETADSLFVWSSLNLLYVFGISGRLGEGIWDDSGWGNRKDRILGMGWIPMLRGVQTVMSPSFYTLLDGPLGELLCIGNWDDIDPDKVLEANDQRFCLTREAWENSPDAQTYEKTLQVLRKCRMFMAQFSSTNTEAPQEAVINRVWQGAFLFVPFAPEEYFTLLQQRQPPALILYAFYGALLHALNDSWFMEGWGYDIVELVDDLLGPYWKHWISWPLEVVGLHTNK